MCGCAPACPRPCRDEFVAHPCWGGGSAGGGDPRVVPLAAVATVVVVVVGRFALILPYGRNLESMWQPAGPCGGSFPAHHFFAVTKITLQLNLNHAGMQTCMRPKTGAAGLGINCRGQIQLRAAREARLSSCIQVPKILHV